MFEQPSAEFVRQLGAYRSQRVDDRVDAAQAIEVALAVGPLRALAFALSVRWRLYVEGCDHGRRSIFAGQHDGHDALGHFRVGRLGRVAGARQIVVVEFEKDALAPYQNKRPARTTNRVTVREDRAIWQLQYDAHRAGLKELTVRILSATRL